MKLFIALLCISFMGCISKEDWKEPDNAKKNIYFFKVYPSASSQPLCFADVRSLTSDLHFVDSIASIPCDAVPAGLLK